jgi:hypothetical protein
VLRFTLMLALAGCSTMTLRVGGVMVGDRPVFQASVEVGVSGGGKRAIDLTHEYGVQADAHAAPFAALNADVIVGGSTGEGDDEGPVFRLGPRLRASKDSNAIMARSAFFTGIEREAKTHSGGLGVEIAGGIDTMVRRAVFEASLVMHGRWPIW